jgi:ATP-dependent RNA helicase DHX36
MTLAYYPLPEMLRTRLDEVILQIKILQLGKTKPFLERVMDPPDVRAVELSVKVHHFVRWFYVHIVRA